MSAGDRRTARRAKRVALALLPALLAACSGGAPSDSDWELLGNSADMQHHADLDQIDRQTVGKLGLAWSVEMPSDVGLVGNPLIKDGVIYQGGPGGHIFANDLKTGKLLWHFTDAPPPIAGSSFAGYWGRTVNRGVALWKDKVLIANACRLIAVDHKSGRKDWETQSCDATQMYAITMAPRVGRDLVYVGNACGDTGGSRSYVDAFDARTGRHRWRFYTAPDDPSKPQSSPLYDMASRTWGKGWYDKLKGCGSVWDGITYDEKLNQLYIGVGGPSPLDPTRRGTDPGDELFTNSIVALDADTGEYKWHFKQVPNDAWNYEPNPGLMVADLPVGGKDRRVLINVPKNGFAYVFDAKTGQYLSSTNYTRVTWTKGLDRNGRPIPEPEAAYWLRPEKPTIVLPSPGGSHGWEAIAYDPATRLVYIPSMVMPAKMIVDGKYLGGEVRDDPYYGLSGDPEWPAYGEVVAWDPVKQRVAWRSRTALPINGGLLSTSGGLVFQGTADGHLDAYDAASGKKLWSRQTGGAIRAAPSTVMLDGEQYLIVATGNGTAAVTGSYYSKFASTPAARTPARLLAFKIGGNRPYPALAKLEPYSKPPVPRQDRALAERGQSLYEAYGCLGCHGYGGDAAGTRVPNLVRFPPASLAMFQSVAQQGALAENGMPPFKEMTDQDAQAIFAYLINGSWDAYEKDRAARPAKWSARYSFTKERK